MAPPFAEAENAKAGYQRELSSAAALQTRGGQGESFHRRLSTAAQAGQVDNGLDQLTRLRWHAIGDREALPAQPLNYRRILPAIWACLSHCWQLPQKRCLRTSQARTCMDTALVVQIGKPVLAHAQRTRNGKTVLWMKKRLQRTARAGFLGQLAEYEISPWLWGFRKP